MKKWQLLASRSEKCNLAEVPLPRKTPFPSRGGGSNLEGCGAISACFMPCEHGFRGSYNTASLFKSLAVSPMQAAAPQLPRTAHSRPFWHTDVPPAHGLPLWHRSTALYAPLRHDLHTLPRYHNTSGCKLPHAYIRALPHTAAFSTLFIAGLFPPQISRFCFFL